MDIVRQHKRSDFYALVAGISYFFSFFISSIWLVSSGHSRAQFIVGDRQNPYKAMYEIPKLEIA